MLVHCTAVNSYYYYCTHLSTIYGYSASKHGTWLWVWTNLSNRLHNSLAIIKRLRTMYITICSRSSLGSLLDTRKLSLFWPLSKIHADKATMDFTSIWIGTSIPNHGVQKADCGCWSPNYLLYHQIHHGQRPSKTRNSNRVGRSARIWKENNFSTMDSNEQEIGATAK